MCEQRFAATCRRPRNMLIIDPQAIAVAGVVLCNAKCLSPMSAVLRTRQTQVLGSLNPIPLVAVTGNNAGWVAYSASVHDPYVLASTMPGLLLGVFYVASTYAVADESRVTMQTMMACYSVLLASAGVLSFLCPGLQCSPSEAFGALSMALALSFYASPLPAMSSALQSRCADSIHAGLATTTLCNASLWTAYGLAVHDWHMWLPQATGATIALVQLAMVAAWREPDQTPTTPERR